MVVYIGYKARLWLGETSWAGTREVVGAANIGIEFSEEGFPKDVY